MIWMSFAHQRVAAALRTLRDREEGQGLAEYALILSLVAIAVIGVLLLLGTEIRDALQSVIDALDGEGGGNGEENGDD